MFSVVIPLYNKEHTILNTLECVLKQTYQEFEVIIVDDGSTDKSVEVLRDFTVNSRVRIIQQENQGVSGARNTGVKNAKYDHIAFLDGDDEWLPEYLYKMKVAIKKFPNSNFFCSSGMSKNSKGEYKPRQIEKYKERVLPFEFFENPHVFLHIGAIVVTKNLFYKVGGFPLGMRRNEDFTFLYSAALFSKPIYSGYPLSVYVGGVAGQATNTSINEDKKLLNDVIARYNIVFDNWKKTGANNKAFIVFMKYELRHTLMINSINAQFETNSCFLDSLDESIVNRLTKLEKFLLKAKNLQKLHVLFVKLTKLKWFIHGYQRAN